MNAIIIGPKSGIEPSKEKSKRIVKNQLAVKGMEQKKFLAPPPLGQTMGHGLIKPPKSVSHNI